MIAWKKVGIFAVTQSRLTVGYCGSHAFRKGRDLSSTRRYETGKKGFEKLKNIKTPRTIMT